MAVSCGVGGGELVEPILTTAKKHGLLNKFLSIGATKAHAHTSVSNYNTFL
jgi:hypothetical protein